MTNYGPNNPHPLSRMKTELVWEGKYDEFGNRREVNVAGIAMPLQKIETIDEPRSRAEGQGELFDEKRAHRDDFRNRLIWGDNKLVMSSLLREFRASIQMVYIDPPFDVGADFTIQVPIGDAKDLTEKEPSILENIAYRDIWGRGTNSYLSMLYERLILIRELLTESGTIFVHLDYRMGPFGRCLLDEIFGADCFVNEIIWQKCNTKNFTSNSLSNVHDTIYLYSKAFAYEFNELFEDLRDDYVESAYRHTDKNGERYRLLPLHAPGIRKGSTGGPWKGMLPLAGSHWRFKPETLSSMDRDGLIEFSETGVPSYRKYLKDSEGTRIGTIWLDAKQLPATERVDYPTQKPTSIIEKVLRIGSKEGDLVADFFCGSGTTLDVAERLGRRWIGCDLGRFSVHTSRKRMIGVQRELHNKGIPYRSFDLYNLGRYERQWWQKEALKGADDEHRAIVLSFFKAEPITKAPSPLLHARKGSAFVHVDGIDSIFTRAEIKDVAQATAAAGGREVYILAWDFEMDIRQVTAAAEAETGVKLRLCRIPREIMEKNRTEVPPFFEVAVLEAEPVVRKAGKERKVDIKLTNFLPSLSEVPSKELEALQERAVESGFDFIDFWAIDFDWAPSRPFNHHWQDFRTRRDRALKTVSDAEHVYAKPGKYTACVKVVDVFGCDTSITVEIEV